MFPEEELIRIYRISKPDIKENSILQYIRVLKQYHKKVSGKDTFDWVSWDWIKFNEDILKDLKSLPSKRNYYNGILPLFKSFAIEKVEGTENLNILEEQTKYGLAIQNLNKNVKELADNNIISLTKLKKYEVKFNELENYVDQLRFNKQYQDSLMLFLMTEYKFRNEISSFQWVPLKDWKESMSSLNNMKKECVALGEVEEDHWHIGAGNFIVVGSKRMFISRGQFKTDKIHGRTETEITNKLLKSDIRRHIKSLDPFWKDMFLNTKGESYTNHDLSQRIGRLTEKKFGVSLGTSSINSIFISSLDKDTINKLKELSVNRGTSINVLVSHYFNDI